jgi:hypothetical protein
MLHLHVGPATRHDSVSKLVEKTRNTAEDRVVSHRVQNLMGQECATKRPRRLFISAGIPFLHSCRWLAGDKLVGGCLCAYHPALTSLAVEVARDLREVLASWADYKLVRWLPLGAGPIRPASE